VKGRKANEDRLLSRREFIAASARVAAGLAATAGVPGVFGAVRRQPVMSRVVIVRDEALARGDPAEHVDLLAKMLDAAVQRLFAAADPKQAWARIAKGVRKVGLKVNCLGLSTHPAVAEAVARGLMKGGLRADQILIWDRFDAELVAAGYKLRRTGPGVLCYGTDADRYGSGYEPAVEQSGEIGSCFSKIVAREVDALVTVPVVKDHNLAGISGGMKNFFGAIHNPNKYHDHNCDPYIADVVRHRYIRPKLRLCVMDGTRAQYHGGPAARREYMWDFHGLIVSDDIVAADAVAAQLIDKVRLTKGLKALKQEGRPAKHIRTAAKYGLGRADPELIECVEL